MSWAKNANELVEVGLSLGIGFGLMGYILFTFATSLGAGPGANFVNLILTAFTGPLTTILPAVIVIAFVLLIYLLARSAGLIGHKGKKE